MFGLLGPNSPYQDLLWSPKTPSQVGDRASMTEESPIPPGVCASLQQANLLPHSACRALLLQHDGSDKQPELHMLPCLSAAPAVCSAAQSSSFAHVLPAMHTHKPAQMMMAEDRLMMMTMLVRQQAPSTGGSHEVPGLQRCRRSFADAGSPPSMPLRHTPANEWLLCHCRCRCPPMQGHSQRQLWEVGSSSVLIGQRAPPGHV